MEAALKHHVIELEGCGPVSVFMQGDEKKLREGVVFLTVHDVGSTFHTWVSFINDPSMEDIKKRSVFLHVVLPGQEPDAPDLPKDFKFPMMAQIGVALVTVLDHLRVPRVFGLGDGAGANIITRFAMMHPSRVHGIVAVNNTATVSLGRFLDRLKVKMNALKPGQAGILNATNVAKFAEAYKRRSEVMSELSSRMKTDVLLLAGMKSKYVEDTEAIHKEMTPGFCSMIKVEGVAEPLSESPEKVAEAMLLFCQGMGLLPTVTRRASTHSTNGDRNTSAATSEGPDFPRKPFELGELGAALSF